MPQPPLLILFQEGSCLTKDRTRLDQAYYNHLPCWGLSQPKPKSTLFESFLNSSKLPGSFTKTGVTMTSSFAVEAVQSCRLQRRSCLSSTPAAKRIATTKAISGSSRSAEPLTSHTAAGDYQFMATRSPFNRRQHS